MGNDMSCTSKRKPSDMEKKPNGRRASLALNWACFSSRKFGGVASASFAAPRTSCDSVSTGDLDNLRDLEPASKADESDSSSEDVASTASSALSSGPLISGRYRILTGKEAVLGKGAFSICYKAEDIEIGNFVAIKFYSEQASGGKAKESTLQKHKWQVQVLKELQEPFQAPSDLDLWHEQLHSARPADLFMQLLDYSRDASGEPGPDPDDGLLYVVTELAQCSLQDFLHDKWKKQTRASEGVVQEFARTIVLATAGLHAKGFVHLDMKPDNIMFFNGCLKVIDVDGCARINDNIKATNTQVSFSSSYCSPEWASFVADDAQDTIIARPTMDTWSVGLTICEIVNNQYAFRPQYRHFANDGFTKAHGNVMFLEWLSELTHPPLPKTIKKFDAGLLDLLYTALLVCNAKDRKTCAQALSHPYLQVAAVDGTNACPALAAESWQQQIQQQQQQEQGVSLARHSRDGEGARKVNARQPNQKEMRRRLATANLLDSGRQSARYRFSPAEHGVVAKNMEEPRVGKM